MSAKVEPRSIICRQCGKEKALTPQTLKAKFCDRVCYGAWARDNKDLFREHGKKSIVSPKKSKPEKFKLYTHNFTKEVTNPILTGRYPMFL